MTKEPKILTQYKAGLSLQHDELDEYVSLKTGETASMLNAQNPAFNAHAMMDNARRCSVGARAIYEKAKARGAETVDASENV